MSKNKEIRWGRTRRGWLDPHHPAFDLLVEDATKARYLVSGVGFTGSIIGTVKLDRYCRDVLNAELIIGESTGFVNGIRFSKVEDCVHFKLRIG